MTHTHTLTPANTDDGRTYCVVCLQSWETQPRTSKCPGIPVVTEVPPGHVSKRVLKIGGVQLRIEHQPRKRSGMRYHVYRAYVTHVDGRDERWNLGENREQAKADIKRLAAELGNTVDWDRIN